jgi:acyl-CoA synthetase (AMP-forming)/AMP-acid ligase II
VVAIADSLRGEVPVAFFVASGPITAAELEARCRAALASFKVPRSFVAVEHLPRTALGKIQKHLLPKPEL